jgi:hypothetical protein
MHIKRHLLCSNETCYDDMFLSDRPYRTNHRDTINNKGYRVILQRAME